MDSFKERPFDCIVRKPVHLRVDEPTTDFKSGCAVVDVLYPGTDTVNIGKIMFKNSYSASIEIKMKVNDADGNEVWMQCVRKMLLMPQPHYEAGSQNHFTFTTEEVQYPPKAQNASEFPCRWASRAKVGISEINESLTSPPAWLSLEDNKEPAARVHARQAQQVVLPEAEKVAEGMQQMWAMMEEVKASKSDRPIGRFDVDGNYDINLLSYT